MRIIQIVVCLLLLAPALLETQSICVDPSPPGCECNQTAGIRVCRQAASSVYADATACWTFNDPDDLGNDDCTDTYDLTPVNTPTATGGALGYAMGPLNGSDQEASIADNSSVSIGSNTTFGFSAWAVSSAANHVLSQDNGSTERAYDLYGGNSFFVFEDDATFTQANCTDPPGLGVRYHIFAWYDSSTGFACCSIDNAVPTCDSSGPIAGVQDVSQKFSIGFAGNAWSQSIVGPVAFWKGSFPDATTRTAIHNSAKGQACGAMSGAALTDLESCWDLTEDGEPYADSVGSNTLNGANSPARAAGLVEQPDSGMSGNTAASSSQRFTRADDAGISTGDIDFSWAGWVNPDDVTSVVFVDKTDEYRIGLDGSSNFYFKGGAGAGDTATDSGLAATAGIWYFVAGGYDGTNYWVRVNNRSRVEDVAGAAPSDTANVLSIAATSGGASYHDGASDNWGFWKSDLTDSDLDTLYGGAFYAFLDFIFNGPRFAWSAKPEIRRISWAN